MNGKQISGVDGNGQEVREVTPSENKEVHIEDTSITAPQAIEVAGEEGFEIEEVAVIAPNDHLESLVERANAKKENIDPRDDALKAPPTEEESAAYSSYDLVDLEDITQSVDIKKPLTTDAPISEDVFTLDLPPKINPSSPEEISNATEADIKWDTSRVNGYQVASFEDRFVRSLEEGEWQQHANFGDVKAKLKRGVQRMDPERELDSSSVVNMLKAYIGDGNIVQVPLLNSGFYVAIKPPSEKENILFLTSIVNDNLKLGRETYGAVYSADTGVYEKRIFNFIMQNIHSHSIKGNNVNIRDLIKTSDLNMLKWGFICSMYPKGHQYSRACDYMPNKCRHVKEGILDVFSMLFIKDEYFTDEQRAHMQDFKTGSMTLKDVKEYQSRTKGLTKNIPYGGGVIKLELVDSFVDEYFNSTSEWIDLMGSLAEDALGEDGDDNARNSLMAHLSESASLRKYAHLVHGISGEFGTIRNKAAIHKALESLSREKDIRDAFQKTFTEFLDATNYVIGIDSYKCPSCHNQASKDYIIPIDVLQVFTTILGTRILHL